MGSLFSQSIIIIIKSARCSTHIIAEDIEGDVLLVLLHVTNKRRQGQKEVRTFVMTHFG